jgi:hypothetical protein
LQFTKVEKPRLFRNIITCLFALSAASIASRSTFENMATRFFESATNADMLKELDQLDRSRNGPGFIPTLEEDKAAQAQKSRP